MTRKKPTSSDVAKLAGVSQPTVSMILNHYEHVRFSQETVQKVMEACEKLNYRTPSARRDDWEVRENKSLLAMCPSFTNLYYVNLLEAMSVQAQERGYSLNVFPGRRDRSLEEQFVRLASQQGAAGVLLLYKPVNGSVLKQLTDRLPVVAICDKTEAADIDIIELDSEKLGAIVAEHLLCLGHRKVAYISTQLTKEYPARMLRLKGMRDAFARARVSPYNIRVCTMDSEKIDCTPQITTYETGYCLGKRVVEKYEDITALVGMNDMVAIGIMDAITDKKYRIPQDYSVCGCDNTIISQYRQISMTSVEHFDVNRGREAVDVLIRKIEEGSREGELGPSSAVRVEFAPKLVVRGSTGPCRRKK